MDIGPCAGVGEGRTDQAGGRIGGERRRDAGVVDLHHAASGEPRNRPVIQRIAAARDLAHPGLGRVRAGRRDFRQGRIQQVVVQRSRVDRPQPLGVRVDTPLQGKVEQHGSSHCIAQRAVGQIPRVRDHHHQLFGKPHSGPPRAVGMVQRSGRYRHNGAAPFGVGLEMPDPLAVAGGKPQPPPDERRQGGNGQQGFEALGAPGAGAAQFEAGSVAPEVANGLLDPHAPGVDALLRRAKIARPLTGTAPLRMSCLCARALSAQSTRITGRATPAGTVLARVRWTPSRSRCGCRLPIQTPGATPDPRPVCGASRRPDHLSGSSSGHNPCPDYRWIATP